MQWEAVNCAHAEGFAEVDSMVRTLQLPAEALRRDLEELVAVGLMKKSDDHYELTEDGEAAWKARERRESTAIKAATRTWQPR